MGRKEIPVDLNVLRKIISDLEEKKTYGNRSALYSEVAEEYNKQMSVTTMNQQLVYLRVRTENIPVKTPLGKRGRQAGVKIEGGVRRSRKEKFESNPSIVKHFTQLEKYLKSDGVYSRYGKILRAAKAGSIKASIKLKCLECTNWQPNEIRHCQCSDTCGLFAIRPFQLHQIEVDNESN